MSEKNLCPCGSGKLYEACCEPYHLAKNAPTAEALMRSRYSAYALGLVSYIIKTTHNSDSQRYDEGWEKSIEEFCKNEHFLGLEIESESENYVTFHAKLGSGILHEKSEFIYEDNMWFYKKGEVTFTPYFTL